MTMDSGSITKGMNDKMQTYIYKCDAGSLLIGNDNFSILIPNGYGDGLFELAISDERIETDYRFITTFNVRGEANVYSYDCNTDAVLCTLTEGRYAVYSDYGNMLIEKW